MRPETRVRSSSKRSILKHSNLSEGEQSDEDFVEVMSDDDGHRSNYTNTSIHKLNAGQNDDASSQNSNFSYLNHLSHN